MKLISMTDFVLDRYKFWTNDDKSDCQSTARYIFGTKKYAEFLKQPLTLGMFVPCDEEGNVLLDVPYYADGMDKVDEYKKAREKVLFKGFEVFADAIIIQNQNVFLPIDEIGQLTIEDLANKSYKNKIELTESAIKQIGLNP